MRATGVLYGQVLTVFSIVIAGVWGATQWVANALDYQSRLGAPWFELLDKPVYHPWRLFDWWFFFDAYAPGVFVTGGAIAGASGLVAVVVADVIGECAPGAKDFTNKKGSRYVTLSDEERARNRNKSKVRAKVEHVFGVMKGQFGFTKVRYKGLAKNAHHLFVSCALVNLVMAKTVLLRQQRLATQA